MTIKKFLCCQFDDTIEVCFLLRINIGGLRSEWVNVSAEYWCPDDTGHFERSVNNNILVPKPIHAQGLFLEGLNPYYIIQIGNIFS